MNFLLLILIVAKSTASDDSRFVTQDSKFVLEKLTQELMLSSGEFSIINFGTDSNIFRNINHKPHRIVNIRQSEQIKFAIDESSVLMFASFNLLRKFNDQYKFVNTYPKSFRFIVYCDKLSANDLATLSDSTMIQYQYFMVNEDDNIKLHTFVWYTAKKCGSPQLIEVNRFDKKTFSWRSKVFFISKFDNLHGCHLVVGIPNQLPAAQWLKLDTDQFYYYGYQYEMIDSLRSILNFRPFYNPFNHISKEYHWKNLNVDLNLRVMTLRLAADRSLPPNEFSADPYNFDGDYMAVPPGESYSDYEKMILPFDDQVWLWITIVFCSSFSVIILVRTTGARERNFIFGMNVRTPALNVLAAFFGISQIVLPGRNFARFLVMLFILYCLVIRTAYQGKMFEFMQQDIRKPTASSLEEMVKRNLTFYVHEELLSSLAVLEDLSPR